MSPVKQVLELADWVLYDEARFIPRGVRARQMFSLPIGHQDGEPTTEGTWKAYMKSFLHTNALMPGMLDSPCSMEVSRLNVLFLNESRPLRIFETSAYRKAIVEFSVNRKIYWVSPAWQCASPFALFATPNKEIAALQEKYGIAWKQIGASFDHTPVTIEAQEYFTVKVWLEEELEEELFCHVYLDGVEKRAWA